MLHSDKRDAFRIEMRLGSPVVESANPLYIDALLGALNNGAHHLGMDDGAIMGSRIFFLDRFDVKDSMMSFRRGYTRRPPSERVASEFLREDGLLVTGKRIGSMSHKPNLSSGKLKAYGGDGTYFTPRWYSHAVAWAVGDRSAVEAILANLTHVGTKIRLGYGAVMDLSVIPDEMAHSHWSKRVLPLNHHKATGGDYAKAYVATKGPYWDSRNRTVAQIYSGNCPDFEMLTTG